ncbi:ABC-2 type transport system ATP-binding protein [Kibdelosporangium phytohabitans]|uniref:ABC transporter n=1 Tax=Kibdelosporangium phytohabitans TaxID=860235 RepID=A0A0N9HYN7_9PSEU|nr:ABC transporter [Kibdelosporangium phytohabitans]MBE1470025.1 ABC-2 type transport system ATP-binding protein [Kibdelosporangium phytohabitans]
MTRRFATGRLVAVIAVQKLSKRFGAVEAVTDLSFTVRPGAVTGFLGPNGAGKTTTLRMILGLVTPTSGTATIDGGRYVDLPEPMKSVGAVLESTAFHPAHTARTHLRVLSTAAGIPSERVDGVLELVDLQHAAKRRVGGFSLGMRQRLAIASALLGDPPVLILDEPANGLDPEGIHWLRGFLRALAVDGRAVLVSSHVLTEMARTVDSVVVINHGKLLATGPITDFGNLEDAYLELVRS